MKLWHVYLVNNPSVSKIVVAKTWNKARVKANLQKLIHGVQACEVRDQICT